MAEAKSLERWIWDAACSIRGAQDAPKFKNFILPLVFAKRLCDVFDDELDRIAEKVGSRKKAFALVERDRKLVRFYLPLKPENPQEPVWSVIRKLADRIGERLTTHLRAIGKENPRLEGIIDRVDFNATTHGVRDLDDDRLSNLIEAISTKRLGLKDVEADIIGRAYEYLIRKFAEGSGKSAGEFYTPPEVGMIMARIMNPQPGMEIHDPCCGSAGLLIKCELVLDEHMGGAKKFEPLKLFGQEYIADTWAMANMNMIIHGMEGQIELGDTFRNPKLRSSGGLKTFELDKSSGLRRLRVAMSRGHVVNLEQRRGQARASAPPPPHKGGYHVLPPHPTTCRSLAWRPKAPASASVFPFVTTR